MENSEVKFIHADRRLKPRVSADTYHSVQFQPKVPGPLYQFKLWDVSDKGLSILVKKDSDILGLIHIGDIFAMTFYPIKPGASSEPIKTKIIHITPKDAGKFQGHFLVGLSVLS